MITATICTIGDEILIGQIVDTNSAKISTCLNSIGVKVISMVSTSDTESDIINTIEGALKTSKEEVEAIGNGGLSGAPLFEKSLERVKYIHKKNDGQLPIIAVGGIMTPEQAHQMLQAGASLVQIYSGFIYNGPGFVKDINKYLAKNL